MLRALEEVTCFNFEFCYFNLFGFIYFVDELFYDWRFLVYISGWDFRLEVIKKRR